MSFCFIPIFLITERLRRPTRPDPKSSLLRRLQLTARALFVGTTILLTFMVFILYFNGAFDSSAPVCHDQKILALCPGGYRSGPQSVVESWRADRKEEVILISRDLFALLKHVPALRVCTQQGLFGIEWISSVSMVPAQ